MEILKFVYNEIEIEFKQSENENVMVNATQMAKTFNKEVTHFLENDGTQKFINSCLKTRNSEFLNMKNREDLVYGKQKSGTWMHRILALKFAAWLNSDFEVWVYLTIDKLLFGTYREQRDAILKKIKAEKKLEEKKEELLLKYPEFEQFLEIQGSISKAEKERIKAIKASINQLRINFFD